MKVEIFKGTDKQWYVRLKAANNRTLSTSEGYVSKYNAERASQRMFPGLPIFIV
jgi:uncharacterized protein YegP (UPF0339 family)